MDTPLKLREPKTKPKMYEPHQDAQRLFRSEARDCYEFSEIKGRMVAWARAILRKWLFDRFLPLHSDIDWSTDVSFLHGCGKTSGPLADASFDLIADIHTAAETKVAPNSAPDDLIVAASILGTLAKQDRLVTEPDATVFQLGAALERITDPRLPRSMTDADEVFEPIVSGVDVLPHMMDPILAEKALQLARDRSDEICPLALQELETMCLIAGKLWSDEHYSEYPGVEGIVSDVIEMIELSPCKVELVVTCPVCRVQTVALPYAPEPKREVIMKHFQSCKCLHCGVRFNAFHPGLKLEPSQRVMRGVKLCKAPRDKEPDTVDEDQITNKTRDMSVASEN